MEVLLRKETIGERLGVSTATVNNWIKTQVIPPPDRENYYSHSSAEYIINKVKGDTTRLSARANRSLQTGKRLCFLGITDKNRKELLQKLVTDFEASLLSIDEGILALSFALLKSNKLIANNWKPNGNTTTDSLLANWFKKTRKTHIIRNIFNAYEIQNLDDDLLGAFYQSIQSVAQKSLVGSYYTPGELLSSIKIPQDKTVLDPCCGSGGILLRILTKKHNPEKIYAGDIDETALKICFINLVLFFHEKNIFPNIMKQDVVCNDSNNLFSQKQPEFFDFIVTNPPWGSKYTKQQKNDLLARYPFLATTEIFSIALYNAINLLSAEGELYFFLPHSFLNVSAHKSIRKYVFDGKNKVEIKLLGNAFKGVLSESVLLHIKKGGIAKKIAVQNRDGRSYNVSFPDTSDSDFIVSAASSTADSIIIKKMYSVEHIFLKDNVIFALGIVTGNNDKHLLQAKTEKSEAIFRGKDIRKYILGTPKYFIEFSPDAYQQIAPANYFRQKKIVYRFISNSLTSVLDEKHSLFLNSANFFISYSYSMETIVSFFNSDIYTFIFRKKFHSRKVLKSHLQSLPLPVLPVDIHQHIYSLYHKTFDNKDGDGIFFQKEIDKIICHAFSIDKRQYNYIKGEI